MSVSETVKPAMLKLAKTGAQMHVQAEWTDRLPHLHTVR